jgi:hypothetical protein
MLAILAALLGAVHPVALLGMAFASRVILTFSIERLFNFTAPDTG